jgi:hypothetical protein
MKVTLKNGTTFNCTEAYPPHSFKVKTEDEPFFNVLVVTNLGRTDII